MVQTGGATTAQAAGPTKGKPQVALGQQHPTAAPAVPQPSASTAAPVAQQQQPAAPPKPDIVEVGWQFVQEYYTILSKEPNRLYCFYSKHSSMYHGAEGEMAQLCQGQQEIHARIKELDFQDVKVVISNVDCMASLNGSILVMVLGEMESKGLPSRKFSQTFFLATQPSGFYVLNDVFRYLKEEFVPENECGEPDVEDEMDEPVAPVSNGDDYVVPVQSVIAHMGHLTLPNTPYSDGTEPPVKRVATSAPAAVEKPKQVPVQQQPVSQKQAPLAAAPAAAPEKPQQPAATAPSRATGSTTPSAKTWASLVGDAASKGPSAISAHTESPPKSTPAPVSVAAPGPGTKKNGGSGQRPSGERGPSEGPLGVMLRGFTKPIKVMQVKEEFAKVAGVVRWIEIVAEDMAFVEFVEASTVEKAGDLGRIMINGDEIQIAVDKRPRTARSYNGGNRRGGKSSGKKP